MSPYPERFVNVGQPDPGAVCIECGQLVNMVELRPYPNQPSSIRRYPVTLPCEHSAGWVVPSWVKCTYRRLDEASGFQWGCLKEEGHEGAHSCDE